MEKTNKELKEIDRSEAVNLKLETLKQIEEEFGPAEEHKEKLLIENDASSFIIYAAASLLREDFNEVLWACEKIRSFRNIDENYPGAKAVMLNVEMQAMAINEKISLEELKSYGGEVLAEIDDLSSDELKKDASSKFMSNFGLGYFLRGDIENSRVLYNKAAESLNFLQLESYKQSIILGFKMIDSFNNKKVENFVDLINLINPKKAINNSGGTDPIESEHASTSYPTKKMSN